VKSEDFLDLASERLGGSVLYATDDYFAEKENLLRPAKPVWKEHEYTNRGKWMDGWESRRKRTPGHDFAVIRLGLRGVMRGVVVDTSFFRGNYPSHCSIEACAARPESDVESLLAANWIEILPKSELKGDSENHFAVDMRYAFTHLRLNIYPDGGVARLRVHGEVVPEWRREGGLSIETDLAAAEHGGDVLACSDMFFGPKHNLIMPGRAVNMSDGWETKRRRGPGNDWVIVQLAAEGLLRRVEIDTNHFKGNYPDTCSIEGTRAFAAAGVALNDVEWFGVLPRTKLQGHTRHIFIDELAQNGPVTYLRLNVFPDGGNRGRLRRCRRQVCQYVDRRSRGCAAQELLRIDGVGAAHDGCESVPGVERSHSRSRGDLARVETGRMARSVCSASAYRRPIRFTLGTAGAVGNRFGIEREHGRACRREPRVRGALRIHLHRLRHRPQRRRDAGHGLAAAGKLATG
jgi:allantoicase